MPPQLPTTMLLAMLMNSDWARQLMNQLWQSATGGNPMGQSPVWWDPGKTLGSNYLDTQRLEQMYGMYGDAIKDAMTYSGVSAARGFYESVLGYSSEQAAQAAQSGNQLQSIITGLLIEPQAKQAARRMGLALAGQRSQWDNASDLLDRHQINTDESWGAAGSELIKTVARGAVDGDFYGIGLDSASTLASRMIGVGQFNRRGGRDGENDEQRIRRFGQTLRQYSRSINALQEVIEGPLDQILENFETFTGSNLVATSTGRVNALAEGMRNVLESGELSPQGLTNMANFQYQLIAPFGGTKMLAASQAIVNAAALQNMPGIEGLDKQEFDIEQAKMNARMLANGTTQNMGAAYAWWKSQNPDIADDMAARSAFVDEMRKQGGGDFNAGVAAYLRANNVSSAYRNSALARSAMNNPELMAVARHDAVVGQYKNRVSGILTQAGLNGELLENVYDLGQQQERIQAALELSGMSATDARNRAAEIQAQIGSAARYITGAGDEKTALGIVGSSAGAVRQLEQNRSATLWGMIRGDYKTGSGIQGMIEALQRKDLGPASLGDLLGSAFGVDPRLIRAEVNGALGQGKDVSAAVLQVIKNKTGMTSEQALAYIDRAKDNLGVAAVIGGIQNKTGVDIAQAGAQRARLMEDVTSGNFEYDSLSKYAGLEITQDQRDVLFLASKTGRRQDNIKQSEVDEFRKTKDAWVKQGKSEKEAAEIAAVKQKIEQRVKAQRDTYVQAGKEVDEAAIMETVREEMDAASSMVGRDTAEKWAKGAIQDVPNENILKQIYQLLCSKLKG